VLYVDSLEKEMQRLQKLVKELQASLLTAKVLSIVYGIYICLT
jgi:hypothetical protein